MQKFGERIWRNWKTFAHYFSAEWLLRLSGANGGGVILARSLLVALKLTAISLTLRNLIDPDLTECCFYYDFAKQLIEIAPWYAAAVGAVYAALYARFSAQWSYLAGIYNQIKQSEVELYGAGSVNSDALLKLAEWKAGYIEDAHNLHLYAKENVAATIYFWGKDEFIEKAFCTTVTGGKDRWDHVMKAASAAHSKVIWR